MHRRRRAAATVATILCLTAVVSCGPDTTAQFRRGYAAARIPLNRTLSAVARTLTRTHGKTPAQITRRLGVLSARFQRELPALLALRSPARVVVAFGTLTSSMRRVGRDLQGSYLALRQGSLPALELAVNSLRSDAADAADAGLAVGRQLAHR